MRSWPFDSSQVDEDQVFALQFNTVLASTPKGVLPILCLARAAIDAAHRGEARRRLLAHLAK